MVTFNELDQANTFVRLLVRGTHSAIPTELILPCILKDGLIFYTVDQSKTPPTFEKYEPTVISKFEVKSFDTKSGKSFKFRELLKVRLNGGKVRRQLYTLDAFMRHKFWRAMFYNTKFYLNFPLDVIKTLNNNQTAKINEKFTEDMSICDIN